MDIQVTITYDSGTVVQPNPFPTMKAAQDWLAKNEDDITQANLQSADAAQPSEDETTKAEEEIIN